MVISIELVKTNLHMNRIKSQANTQLTPEEDKNISDRYPDAAAILMEKGTVNIDELRAGTDQVSVKGRLIYHLLYLSEEEEGRLCPLGGEIPFEEKIRAEGVEPMDAVQAEGIIEDLRCSLINSRKISIRGLVNIRIRVEELVDEEIPLALENEARMEVKRETYRQSVAAVERKDIYRIKEELQLPTSYPAVQEVLWESVELGKWEIHPLEDTIGIQGEMRVFLLYEGEGEARPVRSYEVSVPFSGNLECPGSKAGMISQIVPSLTEANLNIREDDDGETRQLEAEMVLDLPVHLWEDKEWEIVADVYDTTKEVKLDKQEINACRMREKSQGRVKLTQTVSKAGDLPGILQVCHVEGKVCMDTVEPKGSFASDTVSGPGSGNDLLMEGSVGVTVLYLTEDEKKPYGSLRAEIPFSYQLENADLTENSSLQVTPVLEQVNGVLLDGDNIEVKVVLGLDIGIMDRWQQPFVCGLQIEPLAPEKMNKQPGMVVYISPGEEVVWEIGKKYLVSQESIRTLNQLTSDNLTRGQKILLVKEGH